jgi:PAS domain S-box-containing protein
MMTDGRRLRDSAYESLAGEIVAAAVDAIICADSEGKIVLWNAAAERMFGFSAEEAIGRTLDLIIPDKLRERHWTGYHEVMRTGTTRYATELLAVPAIRKDGARISLEFSVALLRGEDGQPSGVAAVLRDVTERRKRDQETLQRLATLEKRGSA